MCLHHAGVLLENSDFGLERDLGPDENFQQSEQVDLSHFDQVPSTSHQECNLVTNTITPCNTTTWSLYDDLYFDTVYDVSEMKEEVVQPVLGDEELSGVVVKETWDLHSAFCLKRVFGFHDDGEPVVRAYVCENGHVSGAWTDRPMENPDKRATKNQRHRGPLPLFCSFQEETAGSLMLHCLLLFPKV
ncbi:hypothetical protein IFM89_033723 [Coptis chinensis]|uniref:Uncharacterized protein n=1 Tax=Coptis chinensis TaxID=261450 RepID=A0A835HUN5_9MAGN|nr:hypothetical protein IFM89_033723 [Coptis chinensis]